MGLTPTLRGELIYPVLGPVTTETRVSRWTRTLLFCVARRLQASHSRVEVETRSSQVRVEIETRSCSDSRLKRNAELLRPAFEVRVYPWTRGSRFS